MTFQSPDAFHITRRLVLGSAATAMLPISIGGLAAADTVATTIIVWPELRLVDGTKLRQAAWINMPAVVVFWETWCPYCKRHNSHVEQLYQSTLGKRIRVIGATTEKNEGKVKAYVQSNQLHFPVAMVDADFRDQFTKRRVVPLTCLVSADGRLVQVIPGEMASDDVLTLANKVMMGSSSKISTIIDHSI